VVFVVMLFVCEDGVELDRWCLRLGLAVGIELIEEFAGEEVVMDEEELLEDNEFDDRC